MECQTCVVSRVILLASTCLVWSCAAQDVSPERVDALKDVLTNAKAEQHQGRLGIPDEDPRMLAIEELVEIGNAGAVMALGEAIISPSVGKKFRQQILVALGNIGSRKAVNAIREFEDWAEARHQGSEDYIVARAEHPSHHFSDSILKPFAECTRPDGTRWGLVEWRAYGELDVALVELLDRNRMSRPLILDLPIRHNQQAFRRARGLNAIVLEARESEGEFTLRVGDDEFFVSASELAADGDGDGLPDIVEERLSTDKNDSDSDDDGVLDGEDANPLTPALNESTEEMEIRQAVFSLYYATTNAEATLYATSVPTHSLQEYRGYLGKVIRAARTISGRTNFSISLKKISATKAVAHFGDYQGPLASSGNTVHLRKKHGKWVVVEFRMDYIS